MMIIATTCANQEEAEHLAQALLKARLVACVNMWPVRSRYWWKKKLRRASEWIILCKTRKSLVAKVERRIRALHSYEFPVVEQWTVATNKTVEQWLQEATTKIT